MKLRYLMAAVAMAAAPTAASAAELIDNGGFENPSVGGTCCNTVPTDVLDDWTVTSGNVNVVVGTYASTGSPLNLAAEGLQYLDLVGQGGIGSISQTFATVMGQVYTLTFEFSHNLFSPQSATSASANFSVDGLSGSVFHNTGSTADLDWQTYVNTFTATGTFATLSFVNTGGGANEGILLDAVSITDAVPEPATWAQLLFGFGLVGGVMRYSRRRRQVLTAAV